MPLATLKHALTTNPALSVSVRAPFRLVQQSSPANTRRCSPTLAYAVGAIMAIGALFGCLNTMYAAVARARREIATLRALGLRRAFPWPFR